MKSKNLCAALVAALILALGLSLLPPKAMAMNEDVMFLNPPSTEAGDPETPGPSRTLWTGRLQSWEEVARLQSDIFFVRLGWKAALRGFGIWRR